MAGGFSVSIGADARLFQQGVKTGVIEPIEDAQDALQDLAKGGEKAGDGIGRGLRDGEKSLDKLGKAGKDAGDDIQDGAKKGDRALDQLGRSGKEAGSDLEAGLKGAQSETAQTTADYKEMTAKIQAETAKLKAQGKDSFTPAAESSKAFKQEATANLSEVASSFNGSAQSITDLFQGTLGGIITELGPLGLAVGTAAAVGVGLIGAAFSQSGQDADAFKERVDTMTGEILDDFTDTGDAVSAIDKKLREWATDNEKYGVSLVQLRKDASSAGVGFDDLATTIAGGTTKELRGMRAEVERSVDALAKQAAATDTTAGADRSAADAAQTKVDRLNKDVVPAINQQIKANENAKAAEEALAAASDMTVAQYRAYVDQQNAAKDATEAFASSLSDTLASAAESTGDALDNGVLNVSDYIGGLNARTKAVQDYQANVQAIGQQLPADLFNFVRNQGPDFSNEIATYLSASPEQQAAIQAGWKIDAQVTADTSDVDTKTADQGKKKTKGPTSEVKGDTSDLDKKVADKGSSKAKGPTSELRVDASAVTDKVSDLAGKRPKGPTLELRVDASDIESRLDSLRRRSESGPIVKFRSDTSEIDADIRRLKNTTITVPAKVGTPNP